MAVEPGVKCILSPDRSQQLSGDVPQFDPPGRRPDGRLDDFARHPDALAFGIDRTAGLGKPRQQRLVRQRDAFGLQQLVGLVEDPLDEFAAQESQPWSHIAIRPYPDVRQMALCPQRLRAFSTILWRFRKLTNFFRTPAGRALSRLPGKCCLDILFWGGTINADMQ